MQFFENYRTTIEAALARHLEHMEGEGVLKEAVSFSLLNGGKRFRPALVLMVAEKVGKGVVPIEAALAVECFHTASLIADDLPCMDDDDFRRQVPSLHKKYGEATALLASYALIAEGYALLAKAPSFEVLSLALLNVSKNTGIAGASSGQMLDLFPKELTYEAVREALIKKTVTLFEISFVLGWLYGGGDPALLDRVKEAALHFGLAFQIADDIEDRESDRREGRVVNLANLLGKDRAQEMFHVEHCAYEAIVRELESALEIRL